MTISPIICFKEEPSILIFPHYNLHLGSLVWLQLRGNCLNLNLMPCLLASQDCPRYVNYFIEI